MSPQCTDTILMVRPAAFGYNKETASDNFFQTASPQDIHQNALQQFDNMVNVLCKNDVDVLVINDSAEPVKPDAIFPNNWITCNNHCIILYPMYAANRRTERNPSVVDAIKKKTGIKKVIDLSAGEKENKFLEGTGSICFDHKNRIMYACRSERTNENLLKQCAEQLKYQYILFSALDENNLPVYHTNVMMCIGEKIALICDETISSEDERNNIISLLQAQHTIIPLSKKQMHAFAGNMIQLKNKQGENFLVMSRTAYKSLLPEQLFTIEQHAIPLVFDVSAIETGGGSVRCMIAELFY